MAITWNTATYNYSAGTTVPYGNRNWTNPSYAYDNNDSNFATAALSLGTYSESYILRGTTVSVGSTGTIGRVWVGAKWKSSSSDNILLYLGYNLYGLTAPTAPIYINVFIPQSAGVEQTDWTDITALNDAWTWTDVGNVDIELNAFSITSTTISVNQLYIKVEYTNDAVDRTTMTLTYTAGAETNPDGAGQSWTNPSYAYDNNDSNRASRSITTGQYTKSLVGQTNGNVVTSGDIKCVSIGIKGYSSTAELFDETVLYISTNNGSSYSDIIFTNNWLLSTEGSTKWCSTDQMYGLTQIGVNSGDWTWTMITNTDVRFYFSENSGNFTVYVNQLYLKVIYYTEIITTYNSPMPAFRRA